MMRRVRLTFIGPGYHTLPDIDADVVRETETQITLSHPQLGVRAVKFSRANGFAAGASRTRGLGRIGYHLPDEEMKWYRVKQRVG